MSESDPDYPLTVARRAIHRGDYETAIDALDDARSRVLKRRAKESGRDE